MSSSDDPVFGGLVSMIVLMAFLVVFGLIVYVTFTPPDHTEIPVSPKIDEEAAYYRGVYESCLVVTWHKGAMDKSYCEMVVESAKDADAFNDILPENFATGDSVDG